LRPGAFDPRDTVNPYLEARLPHPGGERPRIEHARALFNARRLAK
jgi:hypothetical protein